MHAATVGDGALGPVGLLVKQRRAVQHDWRVVLLGVRELERAALRYHIIFELVDLSEMMRELKLNFEWKWRDEVEPETCTRTGGWAEPP